MKEEGPDGRQLTTFSVAETLPIQQSVVGAAPSKTMLNMLAGVCGGVERCQPNSEGDQGVGARHDEGHCNVPARELAGVARGARTDRGGRRWRACNTPLLLQTGYMLTNNADNTFACMCMMVVA